VLISCACLTCVCRHAFLSIDYLRFCEDAFTSVPLLMCRAFLICVSRHAVPALRCGYSPLSAVQIHKVAPEAVVHTYHGPMKKVRNAHKITIPYWSDTACDGLIRVCCACNDSTLSLSISVLYRLLRFLLHLSLISHVMMSRCRCRTWRAV
jgi:hypothetical protein